MAKAKPIVKWLGGKSWIVPHVARGIYRKLAVTDGRYIEPFLGGGALAFYLGLPRTASGETPGMILSDLCEPLMSLYIEVRRNPGAVSWALSALATKGVDESTYYEIRDSDYGGSLVGQAARFIYLNRLCFNGVYRVNKSGKFNVPYGDQTYRPSIVGRNGHDAISGLFPSAGKLHQVAKALSGSQLLCASFETTISMARKGDVIFADPPYAKTFASYTADGFGPEDQARLAEHLREAHERGAIILSTNADVPEIRDLYSPWAFVMATSEARSVSQDTGNRGRQKCLIITTDMQILGD